jgi:AcrR family transcriptional regulator
VTPSIPSRRRNAATTREAILTSARSAFVRAGYDGVGVREIAAGAGVTAMLVNRYFGSKENLFAEVVAETLASPGIFVEDIIKSPTPGRDLAAALVEQTRTGATPLDGLLIVLHSASSRRAAEIGREQIANHPQKALATTLSGSLAPQRAALVLAVISGFQVMRRLIGLSALVEADPAILIKLLTPLFQQLVDGMQSNHETPATEMEAPG